ncbi:MAG TPA: LamG-like jellyroll fold domain-containing protein [Pyrinomonadaceae bacterium]|jgi:hypothetical protein
MFQQLTQKVFILFFSALTIFGFNDSAQAKICQPIMCGLISLYRAEENAATNVPDNLVSWYGGDGDARDFTGANNSTPVNNPGFVVGKVGQAFRFNNGSYVQINSDGIFRGQTEGTIETWVRPRGFATGEYGASALWVESEASRNFTRLGLYYTDTGHVGVYANGSTVNAVSQSPIPQNEWTHVTGTYKSGEGSKLYVNGVLVAASSNSGGALSNDLGAFIGIGALQSSAGDDFDFNGDIDEASVYTRTLSANEIQSIFNAGTAGKLRLTATPEGANVSNLLRDATVTFSNVTMIGESSQTPLEISTLPSLPQGFAHAGLAYNISTSATFSGAIDLCFNLPALVNPAFPRLRVLHLENGAWIDRTTTINSPQLCGRVISLSQFAIAENLAPTAALVSVSGRVATAKGRGINRARISLTNAAGETRHAFSNSFGYYRFDDVPAGGTYVLSAQSKQYVFAPPTQILFVNEELGKVFFTGNTKRRVLDEINAEPSLKDASYNLPNSFQAPRSVRFGFRFLF